MTSVLAPVKNITLQGIAPDVIQSCVLAPPPPTPAPEPEDVIYAPVAPGITYGSLPVITTGTTPGNLVIVDTSPDQIIGCANDVGTDPQSRLNALFPSAVDGDGVVDRATNDIWVYDGATWNNVGPTPGPTLTVNSTIPPWNEIVVYDARVRTRLEVNGLAYALELLTEPAAYGITLGMTVQSQRLIRAPLQDIELTAHAPVFENPYSLVRSVVPTLYTGTGATQTISGLPWQPSAVWIKRRSGTANHFLFDVVRGTDKRITPGAAIAETTQTGAITFNNNGFTLSSNADLNASTATFVSWSFPPISTPATNTAGTITSTVGANDFFSIIAYTGNSVAGATVGHGLPGAPDFVLIKSRTEARNMFAGGPVVGDDFYLSTGSTAARVGGGFMVRTTQATTITLGDDINVNSSLNNFVAYAFRNVPGVCKAGTYMGDGNTAGQFIDCGMEVDFVIIKRRDATGAWNILDSTRNIGTNQLLLNGTGAESSVSAFYLIEGKGFTAKRGDLSTNHDLNISSSVYVYIAFGKFRPTVIAPTGTFEVAALAPTV
jgi:hypothetical protein